MQLPRGREQGWGADGKSGTRLLASARPGAADAQKRLAPAAWYLVAQCHLLPQLLRRRVWGEVFGACPPSRSERGARNAVSAPCPRAHPHGARSALALPARERPGLAPGERARMRKAHLDCPAPGAGVRAGE